MGDLQCPATVLMVRLDGPATESEVRSGAGGGLTDIGRGQVHQLVEQVRSRQVAAVYCSPSRPAVQFGELAASQLGLRAEVIDELQEPPADTLALLSPADQRRFATAIGEIADVHRGQTVLVFTQVGARSLTIPGASAGARSDRARSDRAPGPGPGRAVAEVEVDSDGWRLVSGSLH